jgi:hypothetical protein
MFLRCTTRKKNGKEHRYWNLVENRRVAGGQVVQRQVLYLGEINDSQCEVWRKSVEVFEMATALRGPWHSLPKNKGRRSTTSKSFSSNTVRGCYNSKQLTANNHSLPGSIKRYIHNVCKIRSHRRADAASWGLCRNLHRAELLQDGTRS